jgi:hypothetical protein
MKKLVLGIRGKKGGAAMAVVLFVLALFLAGCGSQQEQCYATDVIYRESESQGPDNLREIALNQCQSICDAYKDPSNCPSITPATHPRGSNWFLSNLVCNCKWGVESKMSASTSPTQSDAFTSYFLIKNISSINLNDTLSGEIYSITPHDYALNKPANFTMLYNGQLWNESSGLVFIKMSSDNFLSLEYELTNGSGCFREVLGEDTKVINSIGGSLSFSDLTMDISPGALEESVEFNITKYSFDCNYQKNYLIKGKYLKYLLIFIISIVLVIGIVILIKFISSKTYGKNNGDNSKYNALGYAVSENNNP